MFFDDRNGSVLTLYQCKTSKSVVLFSTNEESVHIPNNYNKNNKCIENIKRKPNTILSYNSTKCGVDTVDQMAKLYSVKAPTRRWPIQVWYNIVNLAVINSWILYKQAKKSNISRHNFIIKLIEEIFSYVKAPWTTESPRTPNSQLVSSPSLTLQTPRLDRNLSGAKKRRLFEDKETPKYCQIRKCNNNKCLEDFFCSNCNKASCGKCVSEKVKVFICKNCKSES